MFYRKETQYITRFFFQFFFDTLLSQLITSNNNNHLNQSIHNNEILLHIMSRWECSLETFSSYNNSEFCLKLSFFLSDVKLYNLSSWSCFLLQIIVNALRYVSATCYSYVCCFQAIQSLFTCRFIFDTAWACQGFAVAYHYFLVRQ